MTLSGLGAVIVIFLVWVVQNVFLLWDIVLPDLAVYPAVVCFVVMACLLLSFYEVTCGQDADLNRAFEERKKALEDNFAQQDAARRAFLFECSSDLEQKESQLAQERANFTALMQETKQSYPWLSQHIADLNLLVRS